jgi:hypothetical protein
MVRLCQAEASNQLTARKGRQIFLLLPFAAELGDGQHNQRRLHSHHRAVSGSHALDFACNQSVADVIDSSTAIAFRNGAPSNPRLPI